MDDLVAFLSARLDEDEAAAKGAAECGSAEWHRADPENDLEAGLGRSAIFNAKGSLVVYDEGRPCAAEAIHIALHDPGRELREVAVKRSILARHAPHQLGGWIGCSQCDGEQAQEWPCPDVRDLAAVWSGHPDYRPDYRPEWKP